MKISFVRRFWTGIGPATRVAAGLVTLMVAALILSEFLVAGFLPNPADEARRHRSLVGRLAAAQIAPALERGQTTELRWVLDALLRQTPELRSIAVLGGPAERVVAGDHDRDWTLAADAPSTLEQIRVNLLARGHSRGELQLVFEPVLPKSLLGILGHPTVLGMMVMATLAFVCFQLYLRRAMRYLDPGAAVPDRVRSAFDTLREGVLVIDRVGNVMLANSALTRIRDDAGDRIIGQHIDALGWLSADFRERDQPLPWRQVLGGRGASLGHQIRIDGGGGAERTVVLNCSPVDNGQERIQGCLLTLSDITDLEERTRKLRTALADLSASQAEIVAKNAELTWLATRDPLTAVLNRRTLMSEAELAFERGRRFGDPLVCLMCDIDHFKRINDGHGHAAGDRVIEAAARILEEGVGERGVVGRYGGEEFCLLLTGQTLDQGLRFAEYTRRRIEAEVVAVIGVDGLAPVTMSFGVAAFEAGVASGAALIDRADQALYRAKHGGRNRALAWAAAAAPAPSPSPSPSPAPGATGEGEGASLEVAGDAVVSDHRYR